MNSAVVLPVQRTTTRPYTDCNIHSEYGCVVLRTAAGSSSVIDGGFTSNWVQTRRRCPQPICWFARYRVNKPSSATRQRAICGDDSELSWPVSQCNYPHLLCGRTLRGILPIPELRRYGNRLKLAKPSLEVATTSLRPTLLIYCFQFELTLLPCWWNWISEVHFHFPPKRNVSSFDHELWPVTLN